MPPLSVSAFTFPAICARSERNPTKIYESSEYFLADPKNPTNCREYHESAKISHDCKEKFKTSKEFLKNSTNI